MPAPSEHERVVLRGGLSVRLPVLLLLWDLEERGFSLVLDGDRLVVRPYSRLTADDGAAIRAHRTELIALVAFCASEVQ